MADITQIISNFPPAPNSQTDTPPEFNAKADAFVHHQADTYTTEVNTWATQANSLKVDFNQIKHDVDGIVASIPTGTINDNTSTLTSVWSSKKVDDMTVIKHNAGSSAGAGLPVVGTGFVISSGHTAVGGNWVKYADGTLMISDTFVPSATLTWAGTAPNQYAKVGDTLFTPAIAFTEKPVTTITMTDSALATRCASLVTYSVSATGVLTSCYIKSSFTAPVDTTVNLTFNVIQVGRWK